MTQSHWILLFSLFKMKEAPKCHGELLNSCEKVNTHEVSAALGKTAKLPCSVPSTEMCRYRMKMGELYISQCQTIHTADLATPFTTVTAFAWGTANLSMGRGGCGSEELDPLPERM
uniref:Uncharacterized protein n=1 Tax=Anguilla anguilla TaxID=7936 RepID=A0A0E9UWG1_ANGAN